MYAEVHQLYVKGQTAKRVEEQPNEGGQIISKWYQGNFLKGNYDKYVMLLSRDKGDACIKLTIDGESIKSSLGLKLFGVTIDDKLNFSIHISNVCKKASKNVNVLVRMRNMIPFQAKLQLYKSAILPNLTYCHVVWHFCSASDNRKLERVQKRALRAIFNDRSINYEALLRKQSCPHSRGMKFALGAAYKLSRGRW